MKPPFSLPVHIGRFNHLVDANGVFIAVLRDPVSPQYPDFIVHAINNYTEPEHVDVQQ